MGFELTALVVIGTVVVNQTTIRSRTRRHRYIHRLDNANTRLKPEEKFICSIVQFYFT